MRVVITDVRQDNEHMVYVIVNSRGGHKTCRTSRSSTLGRFLKSAL